MIQVAEIDHVALLVRDMPRAIQWYHDVLGMERRYQDVWTGTRDPVVMASGSVQLALFLPASDAHVPSHDRNEHVAFRVDGANFALARQFLDEQGIPVTLWDHQICRSLYFFDPDGNQIEITTFELA
jgi:catechol 2,3-dioxygenase-like lactoylglutathione lyase family enzyme